MKRSGVADLPLHGGRVPQWLAERMTESLNFLRTSLDAAKVGNKEKVDGFRRLEHFVRAVEKQLKPEANFDAVIAHENEISPSLDGRSVFADKRRRHRPGPHAGNNPRQRSLF